MRNSWAMTLAAPLLCGVLIVGCGGDDGANDERRVQEPMTNRPEDTQAADSQNQAQRTVSLTGCVETAAGTDQLALRNVHLDDAAQSDSERDTTSTTSYGITEGSWVKLAADDDQQLEKYVGQQVRVSGVVTDTGGEPVGTSGSEGVGTASGDRSRAASPEGADEKVRGEAGRIAQESVNTGVAPQVRVTAVEGTGQTCETPATRGKER